jgi:hypothetical protein
MPQGLTACRAGAGRAEEKPFQKSEIFWHPLRNTLCRKALLPAAYRIPDTRCRFPDTGYRLPVTRYVPAPAYGSISTGSSSLSTLSSNSAMAVA